MKYCSDCGLYFEDSVDICSSCGEKLDPIGEPITKPEIRRKDIVGNDVSVKKMESLPAFIQQSGHVLTINGLIRDVSSQELLQSKLTKIIHAVFSGEPYQFSHTSTITTFRIEEYPGQNGLVVNARDIMLYGSIKGRLIPGDDVTVTVVRKNGTLIAKKIINHSVDAEVKTQPSISAGIIRAFAIALALCVMFIIYGFVTADYDAIGKAVTDAVSSFIPTLALGGAAYYYVKKKFKR